jgi:DNA-binding transcriptional LysR family regulator
MELRHLRYFVGVAEALSFTKAADKLNTSQPSLTRQIRDLENELGVRLLHRTKQKVGLTDEGRFFLADAKRLLALAAATVESVRQLHSGEARTLNVGYVSNLFSDLLPKTLDSFHQTFPAIAVNLFDLSCGEQFHALEEGKLDLGFVGLHEPIARRGLEFRSIASYKTVVALPKGNRLTTKATIDLKSLSPLFFVGMSEASYPGYRDWLTKTCQRANFTPKIVQDVGLERTMIHAVAAGLGVALVPDQKSSSTKTLSFVRFSPPS